MNNVEIDKKNQSYWDEMCGSSLAAQLGIKDDSLQSLKIFDDWYMDFYPYLSKHIPFEEFSGKQVLEVGLGYGTVGQKIAESGAGYAGLDIANGPVAFLKHRLMQSDLKGTVQQGSVLEAPFDDESFDWIVAIGCFHHTGDTQKALDEAWRMLRPGGKAMVMVYSAYSYRRWVRAFPETLKCFIAEIRGQTYHLKGDEFARKQYDTDTKGQGAPETAFFSSTQMRKMGSKWKSVTVRSENIGDELILRVIPRKIRNKLLGPVAGLDIYCLFEK